MIRQTSQILRAIYSRSINVLIRKAVSPGVIPKEYIRQHLPDDPVIIEAGAHIGVDTRAMSKLWPKGCIHAFEPVPNLFEQLKNNTASCTNVKQYRLALGGSDGYAKMFVSGGASTGSSSLLPPKEHLALHPNIIFSSEIAVQVITMDSWAEQYSIQSVDFLWLDLQGYELSVLQAGPGILKTVKTIYTEVSLVETYEGVPLYPECRRWLEMQDFLVEREELPWPAMGNVLFVRR